MRIDKTRRDHFPLCQNFLLCGLLAQISNRTNPVPNNPHIANLPRLSCSIDDQPAADKNIKHNQSLPFSFIIDLNFRNRKENSCSYLYFFIHKKSYNIHSVHVHNFNNGIFSHFNNLEISMVKRYHDKNRI